ncbi:MAG: hypothetical protein RLZZ419_188 [Pseudomonadota bacterium]|jgi:hypothetical protein
MPKIKLLLCAIIVCFAARSYALQETTFKPNEIACLKKADYEKLLKYVSDHNQKAFSGIMDSGDKCLVVKSGTSVFILDGQEAKSAGIIPFHFKGNTERFWAQRAAFID